MNEKTASEVLRHLWNVQSDLAEALRLIQATCDPEEFARYRKSIGLLIGRLLTDIEYPIYREHLHLAPDRLRPLPWERSSGEGQEP